MTQDNYKHNRHLAAYIEIFCSEYTVFGYAQQHLAVSPWCHTPRPTCFKTGKRYPADKPLPRG